MKKIIAIAFCLFSFYNIAANHEKYVRGALPWGFFANFLWAINHIEYCLANDKTPVIYWGPKFAYYSPKGYNTSHNGWEYYFEPISKAFYRPKDHLHTEFYYNRDNNFSSLWRYGQYIENKHFLSDQEQQNFKEIDINHRKQYLEQELNNPHGKYVVGSYHLYDKRFRKWIYDNILIPFIKVKPSIKKKADQFYFTHFDNKKTIGIHLRGKHKANEALPVPPTSIFKEANRHAQNKVQFFIATDQLPLLKKQKNNLRAK